MNKFKFEQNAVFESFKKAFDRLKEALEHKDLSDEKNQELIQNIIDILEHVEWSLKKSDHKLVNDILLDPIRQRLMRISSTNVVQKTTFHNNVVFQLTPNIIKEANAILQLFPFPLTRKYFVNEATNKLAEFTDEIVSKQKNLEEEFNTSVRNIEEQKSEIEKKLTQDSESMGKQLTLLTQKLDDRDKEIEKLRNETATLNAEISQEAKSKATVFDGLIVDRKNQLQEWQNELESEGKTHLEKIEKIYNTSANIARSGEFLSVSNSENLSFRIWTGVAIILFAIATLVTFNVNGITDNALGYSQAALNLGETTSSASISIGSQSPVAFIVNRFLLSFPIILLAGTFMSFAIKAKATSRAYKIMGTRMNTLEAFVSQYGSELESEPLRTLAHHFFSSDLNTKSSRNSDKSNLDANLIIELLKDLAAQKTR